MKHHHLLLILMVVCLLLAAPAAASVSDSTVTNTNIYAGSYVYDIAPADNVTASTATGISNVAGRYIYASALSNSVNESTATLILMDRQGATVNLTDSTVVSGILVDWGDGSTSDSLTHQYTADGIYNVTATVTNYLDNTGITLTDRVQIGETSISISVSPAVLTTGQSWTLTADAVIADTVQWQVSRNNATWTDIPAGTYTPTEYGEYYFRAIAYGADVTVVSNVVQTEYRYAVTDSTVTNTNVYAGSSVYSIAPDGYYDSASTATGISNVANRYIYASALGNTVNESTATLILLDRQGATVNLTDSTVVSGISVDWGDGSTSDSLAHQYAADGIYNVTATVSNYLDQTGITLTDRVQIGETSISISVSPAVLTTGQSWTLTADAVIADTVQWQVSRNNATWTDIPAGTYTPTEYGEYYFRAIAYGADISVISNVVQTEYRYAVTDSTVVNTNVYAGSNVYSIAPDGYYDTASTATGISNVANRYIYASALNAETTGATITYSISGQQGSTTLPADIGTVQGIVFDYGDGMTGNSWQHTYSSPGKYDASLQLTNALTSTGITLTADRAIIGPFIENITADKTSGGAGTAFNITINAEEFTHIQWYLSRYADGLWYVITGETEPTLTYVPNKYGDWYFRATVSNSTTGFSVQSDIIKVTLYQPPNVVFPQISPNKGPLSNTITLSATVDSPGTPALQWQRSTDGSTWTDISGATTATWIGTQSMSSGKTYYRLEATGPGGTSYSSTLTYTAYAAPVIADVSASASVVALPGSVTLTASASDTNTYTWEELRNGQWVQIGEGAKLTERISTAGIHTYRVVATGYGGSATSSTVTVDAGYKPEVSITSPPNGQKYNENTTITFTGSVSGQDSFTWDFGADAVVVSSGLTSTVNYTDYGYKDIKLTASNKYGTTVAGITIYIVSADRPVATDKFDPIDTSLVDNFVNQFDTPTGEMPNPVNIVMSLYEPLDDALKGFFWVLVFGAIMIVIWLITKSIAVPSVLGILFGAFMVSFMPDMYILPAAALIAAGCIGGLIYVITKHN